MQKIEVNEDQRNKLNLFLRRFEQLKRTRFFSDPELRNIQYEFKVEKVDEVFRDRSQIKVPDEDTIKSFLLSFRVFYLENEKTNFYSICNLLYKKIADERVRSDLVTIRSSYTTALNRGSMNFNFLGKRYSPRDVVDLWFNAEYFHTDIGKVKELDTIKNSPAKELFLYLLIKTVITLTNHISILKGITVWATSG